MTELKEDSVVTCKLCGVSVEVKRRTDIVTLDVHTGASGEHCRNSASSENHDKEHYEQLDTLGNSEQL